jgi:mono/diheme cytochrome c family protein
MQRPTLFSSLVLFGLFGAGCGGSSDYGAAQATTFQEQTVAGQQLYGARCASCHGAGGGGTAQGPAVVGLKTGALPLEPRPGSKRTNRFVTVADVAAFATKNMPGDAPGTLTADEYWAILAFDLKANDIVLDKKLGPELAATLTIPR